MTPGRAARARAAARRSSRAPPDRRPAAGDPVHRRDRRAPASRFRHNRGAFGKKYLPETMGSGVAFFDYDSDGWPDVFFVNATQLAGPARAADLAPALYRNNRDGTFTDVTKAAGLGVADVRHRRRPPPTTTTTARRPLRHRARRQPPVPQPRRRHVRRRHREGRRRRPAASRTSAPVLRLRQGRQARPRSSPTTSTGRSRRTSSARSTARRKSYCTPESYKGQSPTLFHNRGDGTFEDVTRKAGLVRPDVQGARRRRCSTTTTTAGSTSFVANDTQPNKLYRNNGDGTFTDVGHDGRRRVQRGRRGARRHGRRRRRLRRTRAAEPGHRQLLERDDGALPQRGQRALHRRGPGLDHRPGVAADARPSACFFFDYDLDGRLDIFAANGHVADDIDARAAERDLRAAAAPVPQHSATGSFEASARRSAPRPAEADRGARRRLRRLRQRRRPRRRGHARTTARRVLFRNDGGQPATASCA